MNNTTVTDYDQVPLSIPYIILSVYVIISWGTYNFVSVSTKLMLIYIYLNR